jgi:hypothetical protein
MFESLKVIYDRPVKREIQVMRDASRIVAVVLQDLVRFAKRCLTVN